MAKTSNLSRSELVSSSESDLSVSSRTSNRSLRVEEKERRKNDEADPFLPALKYFSEGRLASMLAITLVILTKSIIYFLSTLNSFGS